MNPESFLHQLSHVYTNYRSRSTSKKLLKRCALSFNLQLFKLIFFLILKAEHLVLELFPKKMVELGQLLEVWIMYRTVHILLCCVLTKAKK